MPNSIDVRAARAEDKASVIAFCQNTFSWGDYIPSVWDIWLNDSNGRLFVALVDRQPTGIVHAAFLDQRVAWMEGMRVNPAFRRHGIATALDTVARQFSREHGCQIAQLVTSVKNTAAQGILETVGYQRAVRFNEWQAEPQPGNFSNLGIASNVEIDKILNLWNNSAIRSVSHKIVPNRHWRWTPIDGTRLIEQIQANEVRVTENGFVILPAFDESDWNGVSIHALAGDETEAYSIALAVRSEAAHRGYTHVEAMLVDYAPLNEALERAGYKTESGMLLYEREL